MIDKVDRIPITDEPERGCGFRKAGALYLRTDPCAFEDCCRLPLPLTVCPACGCGVKQTRGWTWIDPAGLFAKKPCEGGKAHCKRCAVCKDETGRAGLLWIGGKFYPSPEEWMSEAEVLGISRRINVIPKDFKIGQWVFAAHKDAMPSADPDDPFGFMPAIFQAFKPQRIEYVCIGCESDEEIEALEKRGITPVRVRQAEDDDELE